MSSPKKQGKMSTIISKTKLIMKLFPHGEKQTLKDFFNERLEKLFDAAPSNFGYKVDIESLLNDLGITKDHLLQMAINSLSKTVRNKQEIKIIASYLFFMQDFLKLIKAKGVSEKEHILLKDLLTLSEAMVYEKQQKNTVLMRYGEKGNTAFIILKGQVDVLIETSCFKNLGEKGYLYYLANLIKYHEYGLVNMAVNENFKKFPIEIIDDITIKANNTINRIKSNNINNINPTNSINNINNNINTSNSNINNNTNNNYNNANTGNNPINNYNNTNTGINPINDNNANNNNISNSPNYVKKPTKKNINPIINIINIQKNLNNNVNENNINNQNNDINLNIAIRKDKINKTNSKQKREGEENNNEIPSSSRKNDTKRESQQKGVFKLNFMNEELKDLQKVKKYRARELLDMFGLKLLDKRFNKKLNHCTTDEFIKRLNICEYLEKKQEEMEENKKAENFKNNSINMNFKLNDQFQKSNKEMIQLKIGSKTDNKDNKEYVNNQERKKNKNDKENKEIALLNKENNKNEGRNSKNITLTENTENNNEDNKSEEENEKNNKSTSSSFIFEMNHNMIFGLKIYSYMKVVTLGKGSLFGEMALNDANSLRKAAIITSNDCHFSVLNKKTFNNCIRMGAQKHLRELLQFFIELPIFSGIPEGVFYHKYYTNLSKFTIVKGKNIITQGEKPEHITLLQTGLYGLTTRMSLYDLTRLIFKYAKYFNINNEAPKDKKNKKKEYLNAINDMKNKYRLLFQNVLNIMNEENSLLNDNMIFKKYYYSQQSIRIAEISCPEVIINDEYMDDNGLFAFSIEAKAPENIIYTLSNKFYIDLKNKNISVKKNQDKLLSKKINLMIQRLLIIRNSMISSFFDYKSKNEVGVTVIRELEDMIFSQLKKKRSLIKKDEKIIKTNENEKKENKEKEILIHINTNLNNSNSNLIKNKKNDINKFYKETTSSLVDNNSYSNNIKNDKNKYNYKLYKEFENSLKKQNKAYKTLHNKKMSSYKSSNSKNIKFNNNYINIYKKTLSSSPNKNTNITYKELNAINKLPFKDNEEEILFSLYDKNDKKENYIINNYNNKTTNTNYNISRNTKNEFTQIKNKNDNKSFLSSCGGDKSDEKQNNINFPSTRQVLMNNLIWENIKSVMKFPIQKKKNFYNYNKTLNNFYKSKNMTNNNFQNYLENNLKCITNRNQNKMNKNSKTEENKAFIKTYNNEKHHSISKDFSFTNIVIENVNNVLLSPSKTKTSYLSTIKSNIRKSKNLENRILENGRPPLLNLKKNTKNNELPNIKIKLKKFYSPQEVNFMRMSRKMRYMVDGNKYTKIKEEKFKINRNDYYKKNIKNRMSFFYGYSPDEK